MSPSLLVELADDAEELAHDHGRETERRLVEEEQLRPAHQRAAEREHLLLAARERPGALASALLHPREVLGDALDVLLDLTVAPRVRAEAQVLGHGQVDEGAAPFGHVGDARPRRGLRPALQRSSPPTR